MCHAAKIKHANISCAKKSYAEISRSTVVTIYEIHPKAELCLGHRSFVPISELQWLSW